MKLREEADYADPGKPALTGPYLDTEGVTSSSHSLVAQAQTRTAPGNQLEHLLKMKQLQINKDSVTSEDSETLAEGISSRSRLPNTSQFDQPSIFGTAPRIETNTLVNMSEDHRRADRVRSLYFLPWVLQFWALNDMGKYAKPLHPDFIPRAPNWLQIFCAFVCLRYARYWRHWHIFEECFPNSHHLHPPSQTQANHTELLTEQSVSGSLMVKCLLQSFYLCSGIQDAAPKVGCVLDFRDSKGLEYVSPCQTPQGGSPSPGLESRLFSEKAKNGSGSRELE
eukprot:bmy_20800T0